MMVVEFRLLLLQNSQSIVLSLMDWSELREVVRVCVLRCSRAPPSFPPSLSRFSSTCVSTATTRILKERA